MSIEYEKILNEIRTWLESKGYDINFINYISNNLFLVIDQKISDVDLKEFEEKFDFDLTLKKVNKYFVEKSDFKYGCNPPVLVEFKLKIDNWIKNNQLSAYSFCSFRGISFLSFEEWSDELISDFERDFDVKYAGYKNFSRTNGMEYNFYFNDL